VGKINHKQVQQRMKADSGSAQCAGTWYCSDRRIFGK